MRALSIMEKLEGIGRFAHSDIVPTTEKGLGPSRSTARTPPGIQTLYGVPSSLRRTDRRSGDVGRPGFDERLARAEVVQWSETLDAVLDTD